MTTQISSYEQQAIDFLNKYGISFSAKFITYGRHFEDDQDERNIYKLTLKRKGKSISFRFGQSINATEKGTIPNAYDLLATLQKYEIGSFEDFCSEFGYEALNDNYTGRNRKSSKIYNAVCKEWEKVNSFFTSDELEELQEIS
jgi:hypothetical protein